MNDNDKDLLIVSTAIVLAAAIFIALYLALTQANKSTKETSITCTTNDSQIYTQDGWKKIETVDYHRIGALAGKGKAQVECKPGSLMCTAFIDGKAYPETQGGAWYWRKV